MAGSIGQISYLKSHDRLAVALCKRGDHSGILYRDETAGDDPEEDYRDEDVVKLFHHCGHKKLKHHYPALADECHLWTVPEIEVEKANAIIAYVRRVWDQNKDGQLPYGFDDPRGFFTDSGRRSMIAGQVGLTCATLVLAIFDQSGLPLIQYESWPNRTEDREYKRKWVRRLRRVEGAESETAAAMENQIESRAYHPAEVVGSLLCDHWPAHFDDVEPKADSLLALVTH